MPKPLHMKHVYLILLLLLSYTYSHATNWYVGNTSVCLGDTSNLYGALTVNKGGYWSSSNTGVASIGSVTGIIKGISIGTSIISYSIGDAIYRATFTISNEAPATYSFLCPGRPDTICYRGTGNNLVLTGSDTSTYYWMYELTEDGHLGALYDQFYGTGLPITFNYSLIPYAKFYLLCTNKHSQCSVWVGQTNTVLDGPSNITGAKNICLGASTILYDTVSGGVWTSSNPSIAPVNPVNGNVTGLFSGTAIISYTLPDGCSKSDTVVIHPAIDTIQGPHHICNGGSVNLVCASGTWTSGNPGVATIDNAGLLHSLSTGTSTITFTSGGSCGSRYHDITVNSLPRIDTLISDCCLYSRNLLSPGDTGVHFKLSSSQVGIDYGLYRKPYDSSDVLIANISGTGSRLDYGLWPPPPLRPVYYHFKIVGTNTTTGCTSEMRNAVNYIVGEPNPIEGKDKICIGGTQTYSQMIPDGRWYSRFPAIARIDSISGVLTGITAGATILTYHEPTGAIVTKTVLVTSITPSISGVSTHCLINAYEDDHFINDMEGTWTSNNPSVATVGLRDGLISAVSVGTNIITFTPSGSCPIVTKSLVINANPSTQTVYPFDDIYRRIPSALCENEPLFKPHINFSEIGINYMSEYTSIRFGRYYSTLAGNGGRLDFRYDTMKGIDNINVFVSSGNPSTGCMGFMHSIYDVFISPSPIPISGTSSICIGAQSLFKDTSSHYIYDYKWVSSNSAIARIVDSEGIYSNIVGVSVGSAIITYAYFNTDLDHSCYVTKTINITPSTCSGMPVPGVSRVAMPEICNDIDTLFLSGYTSACGNVLQWQSSTDSLTWVNMPGAIANYCKVTPLRTTWYRCKVTCITSGLTAYSNVSKIKVRPGIAEHSALYHPDTFCNGPHFYLKACGVMHGYNVTTYYGDGTHDNVALSDTLVSQCEMYHNYRLSGAYTVKHVLFLGATPVDSVSYSYHYTYCHVLPIGLYYDGNSNCIPDFGEDHVFIPTRIAVDSNGIPLDTIMLTAGFYYKAYGPPGTIYGFTVVNDALAIHVSCPSTGVLHETILLDTVYYPMQYIGLNCSSSSTYDLSVSAITLNGRHMGTGTIEIQNRSCMPVNATVTLNISPKYRLNTAYPTPASVIGNTVTWDLLSIDAFFPRFINYYLTVPNSWDTVLGTWNFAAWLTAGDTDINTFSVSPTLGDVNILNNTLVKIDTVNSAYDPNEIVVSPAANVVPCTPLEYTIQFENTGNAPAQNIYVLDTLPADLDMHSVELKAVSALMNIEYINDAGYNVIKFDFPDIQLADSSHHGQCDGFVIFSVKTKPGLPIGTPINNRAGIYFDDNEVVMTNSVVNTIGINPIVGKVSMCMTINDTLADATPGGLWSISGTNATISNGIVTGVNPGTALVTYSVSNSCATLSSTKMVTINPKIVPSVSITSLTADTLCIGQNYSATASNINGGSSPKYRWQVNGIGSDTGANFSYYPNYNDTVYVLLTSNAICAIPATISATKQLMVNPNLVPLVSINALTGDVVCIDKDYSAIASNINGGNAPKYKWQVNGNGSDTGATFNYHPNNNDIVSVLLTSNAKCILTTTASSTQVVNTLVPSISITIANSNKIGLGGSDTLIAQLQNAGNNPTYQWLINNQAVAGETHPIFVTNKLVSNDQVSCKVICSDICGGTTIQGSLNVSVLPFHEGDVVLSPNPNKGVFTLEGLFETNITKVAVDIKDVLGRSAFSATIPTTNGYFKQMITMAHLSRGMYILTLNAGGVNMVKKFVVE